MAARRKYSSPAEQMGRLARVARGKGLSFDDWWAESVKPGGKLISSTCPAWKHTPGCVIWPSDSQDSIIWREATAAAKDGWRRAYELMEPTRGEKALTVLGPLLDQLADPGVELIAALASSWAYSLGPCWVFFG